MFKTQPQLQGLPLVDMTFQVEGERIFTTIYAKPLALYYTSTFLPTLVTRTES